MVWLHSGEEGVVDEAPERLQNRITIQTWKHGDESVTRNRNANWGLKSTDLDGWHGEARSCRLLSGSPSIPRPL